MNARRKKAILEALVRYDNFGSYEYFEEVIMAAGISWDEWIEACDQYEHKHDLEERAEEAAK